MIKMKTNFLWFIQISKHFPVCQILLIKALGYSESNIHSSSFVSGVRLWPDFVVLHMRDVSLPNSHPTFDGLADFAIVAKNFRECSELLSRRHTGYVTPC